MQSGRRFPRMGGTKTEALVAIGWVPELPAGAESHWNIEWLKLSLYHDTVASTHAHTPLQVHCMALFWPVKSDHMGCCQQSILRCIVKGILRCLRSFSSSHVVRHVGCSRRTTVAGELTEPVLCITRDSELVLNSSLLPTANHSSHWGFFQKLVVITAKRRLVSVVR